MAVGWCQHLLAQRFLYWLLTTGDTGGGKKREPSTSGPYISYQFWKRKRELLIQNGDDNSSRVALLLIGAEGAVLRGGDIAGCCGAGAGIGADITYGVAGPWSGIPPLRDSSA